MKKVELSEKAFENLIKFLTEDFSDIVGVEREDIVDGCSVAQLYDEIKKDFPKYFA